MGSHEEVNIVINNESKKIMAENIERLMDKKGVSNQQLCDDLNIKYTTFLDWKKGVTYPRIGKVEMLADYFGVKKSDLIEERITEDDIEEANAVARISRYAMNNERYKEIALLLTELNETELDSVGNLVLVMAQKGKDKK